jgi:hypothetical protein
MFTMLVISVLLSYRAGEAATLALDPAFGPAPSRITVAGAHFSPGTGGQLSFDGSSDGMPRFRADGSGSFKVSIPIPTTASGGPHRLDALSVQGGRVKPSLGSVLASATFTVATAAAAPTQVPTPVPTPLEPPLPTPVPTPLEPTPLEPPLPTPGLTPAPTAPPTSANAAVLVGAGDIASSDSGDSATAALLSGIPGTVFNLGDECYDAGSLACFNSYYQETWGAAKSRTMPTIGNHEGETSGSGQGYCAYFGPAAHCNANGTQNGAAYYSYNAGSWHVIVLNSNCGVTACDVGSAQYNWLVADLQAHPSGCTLAMWHHPRFSSGDHGTDPRTAAFWQALYDHNAEIVLSGHDHDYERFAPQDPSGAADPSRGIREFVVGTGGRSHYSFGTPRANSEVRNGDTFGVLKLTLSSGGYQWEFVPIAGMAFSDVGSGTCH